MSKSLMVAKKKLLKTFVSSKFDKRQSDMGCCGSVFTEEFRVFIFENLATKASDVFSKVRYRSIDGRCKEERKSVGYRCSPARALTAYCEC